ncbi:MAG: ORF6N domain-containing protein [Firmicutes bacterium]|nr:ORF6N domain-containing protein [Bacillota bacterium]
MLEETKIENLIYEIRGKQVMLDSDVAKLYGYETKRINEIVRRNIDRFPENFCFQLTKSETNKIFSLRSQFATLKSERGKHNKYLSYVFTEHGMMMLAGMLKSDIAVEISKRIINAFISMRKFINENKDMFKRLTIVEYEMIECKDKIDELFDRLEPKKIENQKIFFNGEIYDAYSLIIELIKEASVRIIIIDNYIDKSILDMLVYKKEKVKVELVTSSHYPTKLDITKFNQQYPNLNIKYSNIFHDRFLIIDNTLYHIGASLKDLGKKCFGINKIEDKEYLTKILSSIN